MGKLIDLSGKIINRMTVLRMSEKSGKIIKWTCMCECGNIRDVASYELRTGKTKSCGCYQRDKAKICKYSDRDIYHSKEYSAWVNMKTRCYNKNATRFLNHGGRGIKVCDRWLNSFENFLSDMGKKPSNKHSIDRINNDGNYELSNCRWATQKEQSSNRRTNRFIEYNGKILTLTDWAISLGTTNSLLGEYIKRNGVENAMIHYTMRLFPTIR